MRVLGVSATLFATLVGLVLGIGVFTFHYAEGLSYFHRG